MKRKGISPLVAAVLLIAITMTIAGIIAFWTSQFVRRQVEEFEEEAEMRECQFANFEVFACSYNSTSKNITLILRNIKDIELKNLTGFVIYGNGSILPEEGYSLGNLKGRIIKTFIMDNVAPDYEEILITTHCPGVDRRTTC